MMQIQRFSGMMNLDDSPLQVLPSQHIYAKNIRFYGGKDGLIAENIVGNQLISNSLLPTGTNECIGAFYDSVKQRIIWFNYNSGGKHGIYQYKLQTKSVSSLLICFTNSADDILRFSLDYPIVSVAMIYASDDIGDTLVWCDRNNRPMKLNISDAESNIYGASWITDYLTIARPMPLISPLCAYADDATVNINNLRKKLYQFRYRWVYRDFTKSTWSPYSKLFAPANPDDVARNINEQKDNRVDVTIDTGNSDVVKIEIAARQTLDTTFSDNFLVATLDKNTLSLLNNQTYIYKFYNDSSYSPIDLQESNLLFDYVPKIANCMELLNGNVIIFGGTVEGNTFSDTLDIDVSVSSVDYSASGSVIISIAYQIVENDGSGGWTINTLLGFSGVPQTGDVYTIPLSGGLVLGGSTSVSYTVLAGNTLHNVIDALVPLIQAAANGIISGQVTVVHNFATSVAPEGAIEIFNTPPDPALDTFYVGPVSYVYNNPNIPVDGVSNSIYKHKSRYTLALAYFDEFGVTNGAVTTANLLIETPEVTTTGDTATKIPKISIEINSQPPIWAKTFSFLRTSNLSVQTLLSTVTATTKKDTGTAVYAYMEITNQQKNQNNFPAYEFSDGDRVRILGKYGTAITNVYDFPIASYKTDPKINGVTVTGDFIVIPYNSVLSNFGTTGFDHYSIEIYTPAKNTTPDQQVFYEFGETYNILNPGTGSRAHDGQVQPQIFGTQPAKYEFIRGDFYLRQRNLPFDASLGSVTNVYIIDQSVSDLFASKIVGNGRSFVIDEYAQQTYFPTLVRWGLPYQQDTNINQTNRFYPTNFDEVDRQKGDIQRFKTRDRILRVFQNRGCGQYGIYSRFIQSNDGGVQLVTTDAIITANNINYYQGEYGMGDQYTSLVSGTIQDYFTDVVRGYQCRLSGDGIMPISALYKGQYEIRDLLLPYNLNYKGDNGSRARIVGCYNFREEECVQILKGYNTLFATSTIHIDPIHHSFPSYTVVALSGVPVAGYELTVNASCGHGDDSGSYPIQVGDSIEDIINGLVSDFSGSTVYDVTKLSSSSFKIQSKVSPNTTLVGVSFVWSGSSANSSTFVFNENRNAYTCFHDIYPEWMISAEDVMYAWHNGNLYSHDSDTYCNFFGTQYEPYIDVVFNQNSTEKKTWIGLSEVANTTWECPVIYSNVMSYGSQRQQTYLVKSEFKVLEGMPSASIKRDVYSKGGKINGNAMKGNYLVVRFRKTGATELFSLSEVIAKYIDSPPNK
jgi:hypothetical protein